MEHEYPEAWREREVHQAFTKHISLGLTTCYISSDLYGNYNELTVNMQ